MIDKNSTHNFKTSKQKKCIPNMHFYEKKEKEHYLYKVKKNDQRGLVTLTCLSGA